MAEEISFREFVLESLMEPEIAADYIRKVIQADNKRALATLLGSIALAHDIEDQVIRFLHL